VGVARWPVRRPLPGEQDAILISVEEDPTLTPCQILFSLDRPSCLSARGSRVPFSSTETFSIETVGHARPVTHQIAADGEVIHLQKAGWGRWMDMYMFDRDLCKLGAAERSIRWNYDWYYTLDTPWQSFGPLGLRLQAPRRNDRGEQSARSDVGGHERAASAFRT
jgi:hypothetical protein